MTRTPDVPSAAGAIAEQLGTNSGLVVDESSIAAEVPVVSVVATATPTPDPTNTAPAPLDGGEDEDDGLALLLHPQRGLLLLDPVLLLSLILPVLP